MQKRSQSFGFGIDLPELLKTASETIIKYAKLRYAQTRDRSSKPCYFLKANILQPSYEQGKKAQTIERNLTKAILLYAKSASEGQKIESCIKDFASVLHQMGHTQYAVIFLTDLRQYYEGDLNRYDRLKTTLQKQLKPSGKHDCKAILFELPNKQKPTQLFVQSLFENIARIKKIKALNDLAVSQHSQESGKWFVFEFQSFSAAKKTLEKFKFQQWFGINKYWLRGNLITCQAINGRDDFEKGYIVTIQMIEENLSKYWSYQSIFVWNQVQRLKYYNECAKMLIEENLAESTSFEDQYEGKSENCDYTNTT